MKLVIVLCMLKVSAVAEQPCAISRSACTYAIGSAPTPPYARGTVSGSSPAACRSR